MKKENRNRDQRISIERLDESHREEAIDILAASFRNYPTLRYMLGYEYGEDDPKLRAILGFYIDRRLVAGWPVLGASIDQTIVGIALISEPDEKPSYAVAQMLVKLGTFLGSEIFDRMQLFEQASDEMEPKGSHHFLGILGIRPGYQGMGIGKALVNRVKELSQSKNSTGVCLSTEDPNNLPIYERLGFRIIAEADVADLHTWCLSWSNPNS